MNHSQGKRQSTDANSKIIKLSKLSDKDFTNSYYNFQWGKDVHTWNEWNKENLRREIYYKK